MLDAIVEEGAKYGLELNWDKTLQMQISTADSVSGPAGQVIKTVRNAVYLGGMLACDGHCSRELCRRLGEGSRTLDALSQVWSHSGISRAKKVQIYMAVVISKVLYSLDSLWLLKADLRRLDAFHCRSLRQILKIPCSYISRISNEDVLTEAGMARLSVILQERQLKLYERITKMPHESLVRRVVCDSHGAPVKWHVRRGRGRPRQQWCQSVYSLFQDGTFI